MKIISDVFKGAVSSAAEWVGGAIGGAVGGQISTFMDIPDNIWWFSELIKFLLTILSLYMISIYWSKRKSKS